MGADMCNGRAATERERARERERRKKWETRFHSLCFSKLRLHTFTSTAFNGKAKEKKERNRVRLLKDFFSRPPLRSAARRGSEFLAGKLLMTTSIFFFFFLMPGTLNIQCMIVEANDFSCQFPHVFQVLDRGENVLSAFFQQTNPLLYEGGGGGERCLRVVVMCVRAVKYYTNRLRVQWLMSVWQISFPPPRFDLHMELRD